MPVLNRSAWAVLALTLVFTARLAVADEVVSDEDKTAAKKLFERGRALMDAGDFEPACQSFERSARKVQAIGTWLNLGDCYEKLQRPLDARRSFLTAAKLAGAADKRGGYATSRATAVEPQLGRLLVVTQEDRGALQISIEGRVLATDETVIFVTPGPYHIEARAAQRQPWSTDITISAGQRPTVEVPKLLPLATPIVEVKTAGPVIRATQRRASWRRVSLGLGIGSVVVGGSAIAVGLWARHDYHDVTAACGPDGCTSQQARDVRTAQRHADIATGLSVAAGALLASAVVVWLVAPKDGERATLVAPWLGPDSAGLVAATRF